MKNKNLFVKVVFIVLIILLLLSLVVPVIFSQPTPKRDTLLNGLKVLMFADPKADKVSLKIRIHAGSAFDPQGKEGLMQVLADNLFPTDASREFFEEDLGGGLEVVTNYDYIQVNASAKPDQFLTMLETLASALSNIPIDKENTARLKNVLIAKVKTLESDPAYLADRAVARRLFGTFPYGRPQVGTEASLQKIEFPDLIDARERFLTADNATIALVGNFDRSLALRAIKRYFGSWLKSDKRTPSTFRQPDDPPAEALAVALPVGHPALRMAIRGPARSDPDFAAAQVLAAIAQARLREKASPANANDFFVRAESHVLPGQVIIGANISATEESKGSGSVRPDDTVMRALVDPISEVEFQAAKASMNTWLQRPIELFWLDLDTYRINDVTADRRMMESVKLADVTAYAEKLKKAPRAVVLVQSKPSAN